MCPVTFQGLQLRSCVRSNRAVLDGRTLNANLPCLLLHKIVVCNPRPIVNLGENGRSRTLRVTPRHDCNALVDRLLSVQAPALDCAPRGEHCRWPRETAGEWLNDSQVAVSVTRVPHRHPWCDFSEELINLVDGGKQVPAVEVWTAPKICGPDRPKMPFISSDLKATGPLQGVVFRRRKFSGTGTVWLIAQCKRKPEKAARRTWHAKAERAMLKLLNSEQLLCVKCGENLVHRFGAGFVLCETCETAPTPVQHGWKQTDWDNHFDFDFDRPNRKDNAFQDAENYQRKTPKLMPVSLAELYSDPNRPLLDYELALLLAVKYPGFTNRNSLAYLKAQRAAAQIAAHFLFQRKFAEITRMIPLTTVDAVRKFCERVHADHAKYLQQSRGYRPEEATTALRSRMLDSLYAPALITGHLCHSKTCCTA